MLGFLSNLRDVKSALSAGMLMLFTGWLVLGDEIAKVRPTDDTLVGRLAILVDYIGPVATLAVLPFVAYVIGLAVPLHYVGQWTIARWNSRRKKDDDLHGSALEDFVRDRIKRAAKDLPVEELGKELIREVPGYPKLRISYPVWTRLFVGKLRRRVRHLWGQRLMRQALQESSTGKEIAEVSDREQIKMLTEIVLLRVRGRGALTAAALAQANSGAYERFDKARSESEFRSGICLPLLLLAVIVALQLPFRPLTWVEIPALAILWMVLAAVVLVGGGLGLLKALQIRKRTVGIYVVCWLVIAIIGLIGIPWSQVGVLVVGCLAVLVLVLWALEKDAEAQTELENAIVLGHIDVLELQVLEAYAHAQESASVEEERSSFFARLLSLRK